MENDHLVVEHAALALASIDDHALLVHGRAVVLPWASSEARSLRGVHRPFINVELEQLIGALTDLTLLVEHEAATEGVDLVLVVDGCVALTALDHLGAGVGDALPVDAVSDNPGSNDLLAGVEIQATDHIELVTDRCHGRTLPRRWHPS